VRPQAHPLQVERIPFGSRVIALQTVLHVTADATQHSAEREARQASYLVPAPQPIELLLPPAHHHAPLPLPTRRSHLTHVQQPHQHPVDPSSSDVTSFSTLLHMLAGNAPTQDTVASTLLYPAERAGLASADFMKVLSLMLPGVARKETSFGKESFCRSHCPRRLSHQGTKRFRGQVGIPMNVQIRSQAPGLHVPDVIKSRALRTNPQMFSSLGAAYLQTHG
jgi:hypothetical protein